MLQHIPSPSSAFCHKAQQKDPAMGKLTEASLHARGRTTASLRRAVWYFLLPTWLHAVLATGQVLQVLFHLLIYDPITSYG